MERRSFGATPIFGKIGIVGLGLIGGSIALASRALWPSTVVIAVDNGDVLDTAGRLQAIDIAADDLAALADADVIILSAPVRQNLAILERLEAHVQRPAIVTDTGSTKREIVEAGKRLPTRLTFIGGHPLGGAAARGLDHARPDLFAGRPWLFTPADAGPSDALDKLFAFARALDAEPQQLEARTHDRLLAFLSHLPQLTASALMQVVGNAVKDDGLALAGRGLVDTTRLASSPAAIWQDITATNADEIGPAIDALIDVLQDLRRDLTVGERIHDVFAEAARWRSILAGRPSI